MVKDLVKNNKPIYNAQVVIDAVNKSKGLEVSRTKVTKTMRKKLHKGWQLARNVPI